MIAATIPVAAVQRELAHANAQAWLAGRWMPEPRLSPAAHARLYGGGWIVPRGYCGAPFYTNRDN